jgi:hypothetical protein
MGVFRGIVSGYAIWWVFRKSRPSVTKSITAEQPLGNQATPMTVAANNDDAVLNVATKREMYTAQSDSRNWAVRTCIALASGTVIGTIFGAITFVVFFFVIPIARTLLDRPASTFAMEPTLASFTIMVACGIILAVPFFLFAGRRK